jgi:hypothetical protein
MSDRLDPGVELAVLRKRVLALEEALTPRLWTHEMSEAWHRNIPDVHKAFEALLAVARGRPPAGGEEGQGVERG